MNFDGFKPVGGDIYMKPLYDVPAIANPVSIHDCHETVACPSCYACFEARHVKIARATDFIQEITPVQTMYFLDGDDYIKTTEKHYQFTMFDKIMFCPKCDRPGIFGFINIDKEVYDKLK